MGCGFMFWALAGIPVILFSEHAVWRYSGMGTCGIMGIVFIVLAMFVEQEPYKRLKEEPLIVDYEYLKELSGQYILKKKRYMAVAVPGTVLFITGILVLALTEKGYFAWSKYHVVVFLGFVVGLMGFIYSVGMMEAYELLLKNEQYSARLWIKLRAKMKRKIGEL